jgi:hypothetical protein
MQPRAEMVHWLFASGVLVLGLILIAQAIAGPAVWARRPWRVYLWPGIAFGLGILMWPVMTFYTNSAIHMVAHSVWAQALMVMGAAELGLAKGKLTSRWWHLAAPVGIAFSGVAFLVHEQNPWFFSRSAFLHHLMGWTLVAAALFPLALVFRPRSIFLRYGFGLFVVALAVMLLCDRDVSAVFGHLSPLAGPPHR